MPKALGDHAHCQGLELGHRLIAVSAIAGHARQCRHFGEPTTVVFALKLTAISATGGQAFLDAWASRPVVLKKPLYGIAYDSPSGQAITVVSLDKGTFFQIQLISSGDSGIKIAPPIVDREPQRLLDKVAADLGAKFSPKLLLYKAGIRMNASARFTDLKDWGDDRTRLIIDLYDDLDAKNVASQIRVQWPESFSAEFAERSKVEGLLGEFLQMPPPVK